MRIAIVGSRDYANLGAVRSFVRSLLPETEIVTGGAKGVDLTAEETAADSPNQIHIIYPDYARYGRGAPLARNADIVGGADLVIAFWDGKSRGTQHAIRIADQTQKSLQIVLDSGVTAERNSSA